MRTVLLLSFFLTFLLVVSTITPLPKSEGYGQTWRGEFVSRSVGVSPRLSMQFCASQGAAGFGVGLLIGVLVARSRRE
jgi:hypothetical protein